MLGLIVGSIFLALFGLYVAGKFRSEGNGDNAGLLVASVLLFLAILLVLAALLVPMGVGR